MKKLVSLVLIIAFCFCATSCSTSVEGTISNKDYTNPNTVAPTENKLVQLNENNIQKYISISNIDTKLSDYYDWSLAYGSYAKGYGNVNFSGNVSGVGGYSYENVSFTLKIYYNFDSYHPLIAINEEYYTYSNVTLNVGGDGTISASSAGPMIDPDELKAVYGDDVFVTFSYLKTNAEFDRYEISNVKGSVTEN